MSFEESIDEEVGSHLHNEEPMVNETLSNQIDELTSMLKKIMQMQTSFFQRCSVNSFENAKYDTTNDGNVSSIILDHDFLDHEVGNISLEDHFGEPLSEQEFNTPPQPKEFPQVDSHLTHESHELSLKHSTYPQE